MTTEFSVKAAALEYAGDVTPSEAWHELLANPSAVLVDVRSSLEWDAIGTPDLSASNKSPLMISWKLPPEWSLNPAFADEFKSKGVAYDAPVFFLCKSGGRSLDAACEMARHGWKYCYNVTGGFEGHGAANTETTKGWKLLGLACTGGRA